MNPAEHLARAAQHLDDQAAAIHLTVMGVRAARPSLTDLIREEEVLSEGQANGSRGTGG